nr:hypothetical protein [Tanacetum cinerariifolium]
MTLSSKVVDPSLRNNKWIQWYLQNEHHALWEVIEFGDSYQAPPKETGKGSASESSVKKKRMTISITTKDMQKRRNDVKVRKTLLLALPDEHQSRFSKDDLDTMSLDDVYNHLKVYEPEVQKKSETNSQNMAFISSSNTNSGKGEVHTASIKYEDITQIDKNDIKEMDIKWNMGLLSMRADRFSKRTGKKITIQGFDVAGSKALMAIDEIGWDWSYMANEKENHALVTDEEVPTEFALMAKSSSSSENKVYDDSFYSKSCRKNTENLNTTITKLNEELSDSKTNLYHYKLGLSQVEARLVEFKTQEIKFCKKIRGLERDVEVRNNKIKNLMNELEQVKKEKEGLDNKLTGFEFASKDLDTLLESQRTDKNKEGLGYNVVPLPPSSPAQVYSPLKKDMSWTGLLEFADDTVTDYSRPTPSIDSSTSNTSDLQNSNFSVFKPGESSNSIMSKPMLKFVKAADSPGVIKTNKTKTARKPPVKYAEMYRITLSQRCINLSQRHG